MFKCGDYEIDETKIAENVRSRLLQRAVAHILNNESAAYVTARAKRAIAGDKGYAKAVSADAVAAWRDANAEQVAKLTDEFCAGKIAAMYDGTLGVHVSRGPSRDPVEAAAQKIVKGMVLAWIKHNGGKPDKDGTVELGDGTVITVDELTDKLLNDPKQGPEVRKNAERKVREDERLRKASADAVATLFAA